MSGQHIISLLVSKNSVELIKLLHVVIKLQKIKTYSARFNMIDTTSIHHVKELRKNITSEFHDWYADAVRIIEVGGEINVPRVAGRQIANAVIKGETTEDYFRMNIAIPFVDHLQQEINTL